MTLHVYNIEQRTPEWHDLRRGTITASSVGRLLTPTLKVASNDTSRALTTQLVAERITGWTDPTYMSDDMLRGVEHEPFARDKYAETNGVEVVEVGFMVREYDGFQIGLSPDGLVGEVGGIEVKCPRAKEHVRTILADEVPGQYMPQIQAALLVSGRAWWDFVSFVGGMPLFVKRVYPDAVWRAAILAAVEAFECAAVSMVADYRTRVAGLPPTERIPDLEVVI